MTGIGRFCNTCKNQFSPDYSWHTREKNHITGLQRTTDLNKFNMFIGSPKKYATGSDKSKAKVTFLESLITQMDEHQRSQFEAAKQIYEAALQKIIIKPGSNDTAKVVELLNIAIRDHQILTITYKGFTRDIYPYASDNKYCIAYCTLRQELRTFRIDRMQYVHASGIFNSDNDLVKEAQSKIAEAPTFRNYRAYRRY